MRKQQIKQFLDLVKTLETACGELKRQRADKFLDLCAEIQEFVSCMFDYAETVFGEDTKLSNLIRELYELLFNIAQGNAHVKLVSKKALEIKSEAANLKADKIEVVFFCYKASMSDSLESIYFVDKSAICRIPFVEPQSLWTVNILVRVLLYLAQSYHEYFQRTSQDA